MSIGTRLFHGRWLLGGVLLVLAQARSLAQTAPAATVATAGQLITLAAGSPAAGVSTSVSPAVAMPVAHGNPERGKTLYMSCTGCHSIDANDVGPMHRGVVGRKAGSVADYAYSKPLKASGIVWSPATLDRWLTNPAAMVPGTKMFFLLADSQDRADIIAYLAELK